MIIGKSDRRITVQRYTTITNDFGERVQTWANFVTVWAELMKTGERMNETIISDQDMPVQRVLFKIRSSSESRAIKADDRVIYDSKTYDLLGIAEIGRRDQLVLLCSISGT